MFGLQIKRNKTTGNLERCNAQLVILGNQQGTESLDKDARGTVPNDSLNMSMSLQAKKGAESMVQDIEKAYLTLKALFP